MIEDNHHSEFYPAFSQNKIEAVYFETAKFLWKTYVPKSGQAETVQGELIRIIVKLDYEIAGNAKANWDKDFVKLGKYLRDTLINSGIFPDNIQTEIKQDINLLIRRKNEVRTDEDIYDRITRRIVEWYWRHKEPIKHEYNPEINR